MRMIVRYSGRPCNAEYCIKKITYFVNAMMHTPGKFDSVKTIPSGWYDRPAVITKEPRLQHDSWQGTLWLAPDFAILHGAAGATDSHAHYAHQLMLSTGAPFTAELDGIVHTAQHLLVESL